MIPARLRLSFRRLLLATGTLVFVTGSVQGFRTFGVSWVDHRVAYRINPNFPDTDRTGTPEQQVETLRSAADAWRDQSAADFRFVLEGTTTRGGFNGNDGVNSISWVNSDGGDALAATVINFVGIRMTAFDIVLFARTSGSQNRWSGARDPAFGTIDIAGVAAHEFGHALGLDHTNIREATMFPAVTNRGLELRTLHSDDIAGVESIYGEREGADPLPAILEVTPSIGPREGGNEVVLRGRNFTWKSDTLLRFGDDTISRSLYEVESLNLIRISSLPAGDTGSVTVSIDNGLGMGSLLSGYRFGPPLPGLDSIDPVSGPVTGGLSITVEGRNFTGEARIFIGGRPLENAQVVDPETIVGRLPAADAASTVDVTLTQGMDTAELQDAFTYRSEIFRIGHSFGAPGESGVAIEALASSDVALSGISFSFSHDPQLVTIDSVTVEGTVAADAQFAAPNIDNEAGITTFGIVMSFVADTPNIPPGEDQLVAVIRASIPEDVPVFTEIPLVVEEIAGSPPIELLFTPVGDPTGIRPFAFNGKVTVGESRSFLRGDADDNGRLEITDAIHHLQALFVGGPASPCEDAADSNDDGELDLSDAVYSLNYLFLGGNSPPPPFPEPGIDPTTDNLVCNF